MAENVKEITENSSISGLLARVNELEKSLGESRIKEKVAIEFAQEINSHYQATCKQNEELLARIKGLEDPQERYDSVGLGWLSKIVLLLKRTGRPMRSREIFPELQEMDKKTGAMRWLANPEGQISVVLHSGVISGRLRHFRVRGTRGGYYALEEWVDKDGNLVDEMKLKLV